MKLILSTFFILFIFFSCSNNQEGWPKEEQDFYYQICFHDLQKKPIEENQAKKLCSCTLEKVMQEHPNVENFSIERDELRSIIKKCIE